MTPDEIEDSFDQQLAYGNQQQQQQPHFYDDDVSSEESVPPDFPPNRWRTRSVRCPELPQQQGYSATQGSSRNRQQEALEETFSVVDDMLRQMDANFESDDDNGGRADAISPPVADGPIRSRTATLITKTMNTTTTTGSRVPVRRHNLFRRARRRVHGSR